ncbi:TIGR02679 family protein [Allokutzneria oryzae]|uniref:TIGR02679 family protein n=1 Tax=Allokutzneria oryzae TaxID=1378989 RepID=A0ABV6A5P9_9PSEU
MLDAFADLVTGFEDTPLPRAGTLRGDLIALVVAPRQRLLAELLAAAAKRGAVRAEAVTPRITGVGPDWSSGRRRRTPHRMVLACDQPSQARLFHREMSVTELTFADFVPGPTTPYWELVRDAEHRLFEDGREQTPEARLPMLANIVEPQLSPALRPLWQAVHARLSTGRPVSRIRVGPLDLDQRTAIADLLGSARLPGDNVDITLARLDQVLRERTGRDARDLVTQLIGPVGDRAAQRREAAARRAELWDWLATHPVISAQPALTDWAAGVRRAGLIDGSVARTKEELGKVLEVLAELPAAGQPLPAFSDDVLDDPHALDEGKRCANLVMKALVAIYDVPAPVDAPERRALWERAGIADDQLSSTVLGAGLRIVGDDVVSGILRLCADSGVAAALTLQQLRAASTLTSAPREVWVFENPSVLAVALDRFGAHCPPLVCTSGWPNSAGILLLNRLREAGSTLHYHGDFDGEGLRIAANVVARTGAAPWRMSSADYLTAAADGPPVGRVTPVPWDPDLAGHLSEVGRAVPEERLANALLDEIVRRTTR